MKNKFKSIFISDIHIGSSHCKAEQLLEFLKTNKCETLYLIGDILDLWKLKKNFNIPKQQVSVIQHILKMSKKGTNIKYVLGNHDSDIRPFLKYNILIENIEIRNEFVHEGIAGKRYLITHGDLFDFLSTSVKWITHLGDYAYTVALHFNTFFNYIRKKLNLPYWSISRYLKNNVKEAVSFIFEFEKILSEYAKKRGFDGVIVGHIHSAEIKKVDDIIYMNDGDFVESVSAIVETYDGIFILMRFDMGEWITVSTFDPITFEVN